MRSQPWSPAVSLCGGREGGKGVPLLVVALCCFVLFRWDNVPEELMGFGSEGRNRIKTSIESVMIPPVPQQPLRLFVHRDKICSCKLRLAELIADHRNGGGFVTEFFTPLHSVLYQSYRDISVGIRHRFW
ncbi:hypothetical protein BHM03_00000850 [Ensete ventricosum]|nr:hypothetical protein BHM03_00000850 [Ensete ventricosum]